MRSIDIYLPYLRGESASEWGPIMKEFENLAEKASLMQPASNICKVIIMTR